jgi:peptidoglycan hydrolase-like protein with peptidoglycan-binding domain
MLQALGWSGRDAVGFLAGGLATVAILINVLFLQTGVHPAPMFKAAFTPPAKPVVTSAVKPVVAATEIPTATVPRPRPADLTPAKAAPPPGPRAPGEIITDIQRELVRRGFYDGAVDGLYGPKTDGAIRDFEQAAGLKPSTEPSEALLQAMLRAPAKLAKAVTTGATPAPRPPLPVRNDAADRPAPSKRVIALQRALADFGYGQIKPSGIVDAETQVAIEKFERERKLPVTGQPSDRVMREMTAMTGRPLE